MFLFKICPMFLNIFLFSSEALLLFKICHFGSMLEIIVPNVHATWSHLLGFLLF